MGKIINNNYELLEQLGQGGMGVVYKARHIHFDEIYAIKRLWEQFGANEMVLNLFLNEAKILRRLNHKNIVHVTDVFSLENQNYIVMEYIKGRSLDEIIKKEVGPIHRERSINLFKQMLEGIAYIHNQPTPIIHRDIKPINLLVTEDDIVKITDFGIAKVLDAGQNASTVMKGTPVYMSPEQIMDPKSVDIRTDVYSLGMTFYEMLCGKTPFAGTTTTTPTAVYTTIMKGEVPPPTHFYPGIPDALSDFVMKAIHKERNQRFADANEMFQELQKLGQSGATIFQERPEGVPPVVEKPVRAISRVDAPKIPESKEPPLPETGIDTPVKKNKHTWKWVVGVVIVVGLILGISLSGEKKASAPDIDTTRVESLVDNATSSLTSEQQKEMVLVEGGIFTMGSNDSLKDASPMHQVTVNGFLIGRTEVTLESFSKFIKATGYETDAEDEGWSYVLFGGSWEKKLGVDWRCDTKGNKRPASEKLHPVIHVSWYDAVAYCNWLSEKNGLQKAYIINKEQKDPNNKSEYDSTKWLVTCDFNSNGYRLPTEAEWEYASKGGNLSTNSLFSGSNNIDDFAWHGANSGMTTKDVGTKNANQLNIHDMSGNVWEWCWDWYSDSYYSSSPGTNPKGTSSGSDRVLRGGGWNNVTGNCRVVYRYSDSPVLRVNVYGFRLARTK